MTQEQIIISKYCLLKDLSKQAFDPDYDGPILHPDIVLHIVVSMLNLTNTIKSLYNFNSDRCRICQKLPTNGAISQFLP